MALNPVVFTEQVVRSFLRYQLTAYPFADERLHAQMRRLLSLDETRHSPLLKGPYVSLSRPFRQGAAVSELVLERVFHPHMRQRIPDDITHVYGHQEDAIRAIRSGKTTLVSTGTGSGKTECFLYPIVSKCLELRDQNATPGISAVIVYPMNALAEDQLGRLRSLLAGTGIPFGMYVGKTPDREADVAGHRLAPGTSRADYEAALARVRGERRGETVYPPEEACSREVMRTAGKQPRILLTNVKQLELLLTRQRDIELFGNARLDFLVFDEAHTFTGAQGAETACLIRRLRAFCGRGVQDTVCVATSATIVDREQPDAAREFASRFFGVSKSDVVTVGEAYERELWAARRIGPSPPAVDPGALLAECVVAVEDETGEKVREVFAKLGGALMPGGDWREALYAAMSTNELAFQLTELLNRPVELQSLSDQLTEKIGRRVSEAEILTWLTLGAAARRESRPLLRPVVHGFVRGISGAVVSFPDSEPDPHLWLASEDEVAEAGPEIKHAHLPITTCTTCGQHYFIAFLKDFTFTGRAPAGGDATGDGSCWEPLEQAQGGKRVVLVDRLISTDEGAGDYDDLEASERTAAVFLCRLCGAAHPSDVSRCLHCGQSGTLVKLFAIRSKDENPGWLTSCLSCGANGRKWGSLYREPARPVRATNVADVHVLAQDMVQHSERPRLLVFCDNRQDAAFQAGWMKDHARRFRLRALMADGLKSGPQSIGDLTHVLDDLLERDEVLSRALVPEVWLVVRREGTGGRHQQERLKFLRIQVLREVVMSARQPIGLEPWGRMTVEYDGLDAELPWVQRQAGALSISPGDLRHGVAAVLDYLRRRRVLRDPERGIFSQWWMDGDLELQQGYLPQMGAPVGTKLRRGSTEKPQHVLQWISERGDTTLRQVAKKWGVPSNGVESFLEGLFALLKDQGLLVPVTLKGSKGGALPGLTGLYQVDADRLRLTLNSGAWRCRSCRRRSTRRPPKSACLAWACKGELEFVGEDPDNYDLQVLDQGYSMLRPEEHTAMVPHDERERLENLFKGDSEAINTFVCTQTLELGVDIGQLDTVLMRNVPPLPANYWQRAGRAGRRHRMAVDLTYCRPVSHDRAYFADPIKILAGRVDPPAFNLRNGLMVAKHVHASVITRLHQYVGDAGRSQGERQGAEETLRACLPERVTAYLFDAGVVRTTLFDFTPLRHLIERNVDDLVRYVEGAFRQGWPVEDAEVATAERLRAHVVEMVDDLDEVVGRLRRRLVWAMDQLRRLNVTREQKGALDPDEDALFRRCDAVVKRLKGSDTRSRREAEGYNDVYTFGVLAAEGFLPGYGLEVGAVLGTAEIPFWRGGAREFVLPRPSSVALREYVPGNLIYANGNKFVARRFHRDVDEQRIEMPVFEVSVERQAVKPTTAGAPVSAFGSTVLATIAVCDVDLAHQSHISDDEDLRFQLGVAVYGYERDQHNGGNAYKWGEQSLHLRRGVRLRLVNVGATAAINSKDKIFGYLICTVCGDSRSPLSSEKEWEHFQKSHKDRCGRAVTTVGFHADVVADTLSLPACPNSQTAYSVLEALRIAATRVLDMHREDLQILVIGHVDREEVDALLWDPMPGGSGLLEQICARFEEIGTIALEVVSHCPAVCESSCIDCLQTFRNGYYHKFLDRKLAEERLKAWGLRLLVSHEIPAKQPSREPGEGEYPVNEGERRLRYLLRAAGFEEGVRGEQLRLDRAVGTTTPDVIYRAQHHASDEGVCIYLDGLSRHLHGNPATAAQDRRIRDWLRNNGYEVIEIAASELHDAGAMSKHFRKLAGYLGAAQLRDSLKTDTSWFQRVGDAVEPAARFVLRKVQPNPDQRYVTCVPFVPLKAAAGAFGDPQRVDEGDVEWIEVDGRRVKPGMFVAQVVGKSMEPDVPDGAYCLFSAPVAGSRQGRTVLVQLREQVDPESGERYTVKKYSSEKSASSDGTWRHVKVTLKPVNPAFRPIELTTDDEGTVQVVAELVAVLG
jgi:ATP-dependent helicase YprA (DUF1998 family)